VSNPAKKIFGFYLPGICARGKCIREAELQSKYCERCQWKRERIGIREPKRTAYFRRLAG
jgi:hypothetical protein